MVSFGMKLKQIFLSEKNVFRVHPNQRSHEDLHAQAVARSQRIVSAF